MELDLTFSVLAGVVYLVLGLLVLYFTLEAVDVDVEDADAASMLIAVLLWPLTFAVLAKVVLSRACKSDYSSSGHRR